MADSENNASTLGSYMKSAQGAVESAIASFTGNPSDQAAANTSKAKADDEYAASQTLGKVGPVNVSGDGGVSTDSKNRSEGQWDQTLGSAKEAIGGLVGSESLKSQGTQQRTEGEGKEAQGILSDYGSGISDRVTGAVGAATASLTGNEDAKLAYQNQHDDGKSLQRSAEYDIEKKGEAQQKLADKQAAAAQDTTQ